MTKQVPFKVGMLTEPLSPLENVRLKGTRCKSCGAIALGERKYCINCTSDNLEAIVLGKTGKVYTHTTVLHPPPLPYPQDGFKPFPVAWVQLDEGLYLLSELTECALDEVKIGMSVELILGKGWKDQEGNEVIMYKFRPIREGE
jgi:uncharacterized OB-fold protein